MEFKKRIKHKLKLNWRGLLVGIAAILFFIGTSFYNYQIHQDGLVKWSSPDENANYVFSKLYAETGQLQIFEKYNQQFDDVLVPRSFRSDNGYLKPVSFLGISMIYGFIAKFFGVGIIPYLTPFFGALAIIAFYLVLKKIFHPNNALLSALMLATFPPFIYYTVRSMFHNVLFVSLLIFSLYFLMRSTKDEQKKSRLIFASIAGVFFALAAASRTSELIWILPSFLVLWIFNFKKFGLRASFLFMVFAVLSAFPFLYQNKLLYGSYFSGGYAEMNQSISTLGTSSASVVESISQGKFTPVSQFIVKAKDIIFYFGFQPYKSAKMAYYYFAKMFWYLFWPALAGLTILVFQFKRMRRRHYVYLLLGFIVSAILLAYYGSWEFHDNPDPRSFTIGNSYTRYWLPVYLLAMPLASLFIMRLTSFLLRLFKNILNKKGSDKKFNNRFFANLLLFGMRALLLLTIMILGIRYVLSGSEEGLLTTYERQQMAKAEAKTLFQVTESNAVIITKYHDKLFFPERKVIYGLFDNDELLQKYRLIVDFLPLYYYNFSFPEKDMTFLNEKRLPPFGLKIVPIQNIGKGFTLYRLQKTETSI